MKILAIESSCDETSAAVVVKKENDEEISVLSNITATSLALHATTGGIIPENAAREQVKYINPIIVEALFQSKFNTQIPYEEKFKTAHEIVKNDIDAIAVTYGPGLIGSLLIGVETAKTLSFSLNKPLIPVNHLLGHLYANFITSTTNNQRLRPKADQPMAEDAKRLTLTASSFPFIGLIVSGAHTDLLYFESHEKYTWLGGTRDDAAGEAFDKIGRLLGLAYPAGAEIERRAKTVKKSRFHFKSPLLHSDDFDFSFSGLKTEVTREVHKYKLQTRGILEEEIMNEICFATQKAISDVLVAKTLKASQKYNVKAIVLGGGVAANQTLRNTLELNANRYSLDATIFSPPLKYCTDNGAMIGAYAAFHPDFINWKDLNANPELYFE